MPCCKQVRMHWVQFPSLTVVRRQPAGAGLTVPDSSNGRAALLQGADGGSIPSSGTETKLHSVEKSASKIRNRVEQRDRDRIPHLPYWSTGYDVALPKRKTRFNSGVRYNAMLPGSHRYNLVDPHCVGKSDHRIMERSAYWHRQLPTKE